MIRSWLLAILGLAAFAVLVWLGGPLLVIAGQAPLASPQVRVLVIAVFVLQYLAQKLWSARQGRRNNERIVAGLTPAAQPGASPEAALLRERFSTALAELRSARFAARGPWEFGRSYLYELPWYAIIGSPGTGKTTALLNSGLSFPLTDKLGRGPVGGFGGTRNCDWWFTDRAVLIDTAGRYTTHESDQTADRQGWEAFLELLRRTRPRQPLNGVLVAVSVGDLLEFTPAELSEHARILRARLEELQSSLRARIPVYLLLTKCDLLPGFVDWFGALGRKERDQVWGVTFALGGERSGVASFAEAFDRLVNHLADGLVERLQAERDPQRRASTFSLPGQLRALSEPLDSLVRRTFGPRSAAAGTESAFLRGVYLTSGTQAGTPIDRMLYAFGRELGLERQILPPNQSTGKSFFLAGLLNDVVLAEAGLTGGAPVSRWRRRLLIAAIAVVQLGAAALAAWWITGYSRSSHEIARLDQEVTRARSIVHSIPVSSDPDPRPLLPALDTLRELAGRESGRVGAAGFLEIGARARTKLAAAARQGYERLLLGPFQDDLASAIDATLRRGADVNVQYEALKAYQMLGDARHFDSAGLRIFVLSYWDSALAPPLSGAERKDLMGHLDALLEAGAVGSGVRLDPVLVDSVRDRLRSQSNAQRIALRLTVALNSHHDPDFTLASLGPTAAELFVGADGSSSPRGVPGRYTIDAFREVVSGQVQRIADELASESRWVLGTARPDASADAAQVFAAYRAEYGQAWTQLLDDLHLKPATTNEAAMRQAQTLARRDGPLELVLGAIVLQTPSRLPNGAEGPIAPSDPSADRFTALARLFARDANGASPIDEVMRSFVELQSLRAPASADAARPDAAERIARVIASAKADPEPVRSMLLSLAVLPAGSAPVAQSRSSPATLSRQIAARLEVSCIRTVAGRFPFDRRSARDAAFEDFSRLFAPKGAFDEVFGQLLAAHVDTASDSWQWRGPGGPAAEELERFRAAARIREVFFRYGGNQPGFQLTFRPADMDESIDRLQLEIDGQTVRYAHGPPVPTVVKWPGPRGRARIELSPAGPGSPVEYTGPWALFRLLDHAAVQDAGSPGHFKVVFDVGGRHATFDVTSDDGADPFRLRELERFDCPIAAR